MAGRPPYSKERRQELYSLTAELFSEITNKSCMKPAELEKIFSVGSLDGRLWRKYKNGKAAVTKGTIWKIIQTAIEKKWLDEEWGVDYLIGLLEADVDEQRLAAAKKIESLLTQIIHVLTMKMPGDSLTHVRYLRGMGDHLLQLYIEGYRKAQLDGDTPPEEIERYIEEFMLQYCSNRIAESYLITNNRD